MKKLLSLLLCLFMVAGELISCADAANNKKQSANSDNTDVTTAADTADTDLLSARKKVSDELPETDFNGKEFHIIVSDYASADIFADQSGDVIDDAVYNRNIAVEDRFNIKIIPIPENYESINNMVINTVNAGDEAYELVSHFAMNIAKLAQNGYLMDWNQIPYINTDKPWWNKSAYNELSVAGKTYLMISSLTGEFLKATYCVYYNKRLAADNNITDLNKTVLDGNWTIDRYASLVKDKWRDLNGNGEPDKADEYGLSAQVTSYATPFIYSFGETTVSRDSDGIPQLSVNVEKFTSMVNKVYDLLYDSNGTITTNEWTLHEEVFRDGRALFMNGTFYHALKKFRDMTDDYGIIPYPKWDEKQDTYYTMSDGSHTMLGIPKGATNVELIGVITEALSAESWKNVIPAIYDVALKTKYTRDTESVKMIDLIESNCVIDFGFIYGYGGGVGFILSTMMGNKDKNFMSYYDSSKDIWKNQIEKTVASFIDND